jgi:ATPase subunit of ABC transporter with duplicated ATPase domains
VSHDRDLIDQFATRLWAFTPQGLVDFRGTYEEYLEKAGATAVATRAGAASGKRR